MGKGSGEEAGPRDSDSRENESNTQDTTRTLLCCHPARSSSLAYSFTHDGIVQSVHKGKSLNTKKNKKEKISHATQNRRESEKDRESERATRASCIGKTSMRFSRPAEKAPGTNGQKKKTKRKSEAQKKKCLRVCVSKKCHLSVWSTFLGLTLALAQQGWAVSSPRGLQGQLYTAHTHTPTHRPIFR